MIELDSKLRPSGFQAHVHGSRISSELETGSQEETLSQEMLMPGALTFWILREEGDWWEIFRSGEGGIKGVKSWEPTGNAVTKGTSRSGCSVAGPGLPPLPWGLSVSKTHSPALPPPSHQTVEILDILQEFLFFLKFELIYVACHQQPILTETATL